MCDRFTGFIGNTQKGEIQCEESINHKIINCNGSSIFGTYWL
jgi:hypothetical protein